MKRVLAALAVAGAQPLLAYSDPAPKLPTCPLLPAGGHAHAESELSTASEGSRNAAPRSMIAHGLVTATAAPPAGSGTPAAQAPASSSQAPASSSKESNFHSMSKSIIQNIRARTSNPAPDPVGPVAGEDSADGRAAGGGARLGAKPQDTAVAPLSSSRNRTAVTCTGTR